MLKKALIEFFLTDVELFLFIIRPDDPLHNIKDDKPLVLQVKVGELEVINLVERLKEEINTSLIKVEEKMVEAWNTFQTLGRKIFSDSLLSYLQLYDAIYLVPFGPLHYLPLHAVKINDRYLIELFQLAYLPSASVLSYLKKKPAWSEKPNILVGGVDYSGEYFDFAAEGEQIWELDCWDKKHSQLLLQDQLTKEAFFSHFQDKSVIHLSSHGCFSAQEPLESGALLAGNYTRQFYDQKETQELDKENILMAKDFFYSGIRTNIDLFVLSACVTGDSKNRPGDELIGLTRGMMYVGANSMIVTLFPTLKNVTAHKHQNALQFANFYRFWLLEGMNKGGAFQAYIKGLINSEYSHPSYWSAFIMVGNLE